MTTPSLTPNEKLIVDLCLASAILAHGGDLLLLQMCIRDSLKSRTWRLMKT